MNLFLYTLLKVDRFVLNIYILFLGKNSNLDELYENYILEYKVNDNQVRNVIFKAFADAYDKMDEKRGSFTVSLGVELSKIVNIFRVYYKLFKLFICNVSSNILKVYGL